MEKADPPRELAYLPLLAQLIVEAIALCFHEHGRRCYREYRLLSPPARSAANLRRRRGIWIWICGKRKAEQSYGKDRRRSGNAGGVVLRALLVSGSMVAAVDETC